MTKPTLSIVLSEIKSSLAADLENGTWSPPPGSPLHDCEFLKVGFRAWGLEAPDHAWRLDLSRLDFGDSNPSALLTVHAPDHANAFGDLDWFAFSHSININGGNNFKYCVERLVKTLGGSDVDWGMRIVYLIEKARGANAGASNGTFKINGRPVMTAPPPYIFDQRVREGRTISIFGAGSAGKTTLVDGLIASACSGFDVIPGWHPVRQFRVLVLDWDEGYEEEMVRLSAICEAHGIELTSEYHYKRMTRPLHDVADEIGTYIVVNQIEIVIISPMGRAQRNFGENITAPVDEVHEILRSFGTTNILIDHVTGDNIKGGAQREFGSIRKRDNVRGSYGVDVQSEEPGRRVLVMRNTKSDALAPRQPDQAIRIEFDPPWPDESGSYRAIRFRPDEVLVTDSDTVTERQDAPRLKALLYDALDDVHLNEAGLAKIVLYSESSVRRTLYRYRLGNRYGNPEMFNRLNSGQWERLPIEQGVDL